MQFAANLPSFPMTKISSFFEKIFQIFIDKAYFLKQHYSKWFLQQFSYIFAKKKFQGQNNEIVLHRAIGPIFVTKLNVECMIFFLYIKNMGGG